MKRKFTNWFPVPDLSDTAAFQRGYIPSNVTSLSDEIDRQLGEHSEVSQARSLHAC